MRRKEEKEAQEKKRKVESEAMLQYMERLIQSQEQKRKEEKEAEEKKRKEEKEVEERKRKEEKELDRQILQQYTEQLMKAQEQNRKEDREFVQGLIEHVHIRVEEVKNEVDEVRQELNLKIDQQIKSVEEKMQSLLTESKPVCPITSNATVNVRVPYFDGEAPWNTYKKQFETAAEANNWTKKEKATALILALRGSALSILQKIPESKHNDYDELTAAFEARYGDLQKQQLYQAQLMSRSQRTDESLQEFEQEISRLVQLAYQGGTDEFKDQLAAQHFIHGIKDDEIKRLLTLASFRKSSEALIRALEMEATNKMFKSKIRAVTIQEPEEAISNKLEQQNNKLE